MHEDESDDDFGADEEVNAPVSAKETEKEKEYDDEMAPRVQEGAEYMDERARKLQEHNAVLLEQVELRDDEIERLKKELDHYQRVVPGTDAASAKILELAKKNRNLTVALESSKARCGRLEKENKEIKEAVQRLKASKKRSGGPSSSYSGSDLHPDSGDMEKESSRKRPVSASERAQHERALTKMREFEMQVEVLKIENMKMRVVLKREVGDGVDISKIMEEGSNWRGRSEKIALLKAKLKDYRRRLEKYEEQLTAMTTTDTSMYHGVEDLGEEHDESSESRLLMTLAQQQVARKRLQEEQGGGVVDFDDRHRHDLEESSRQMRMDMDALVEQNKEKDRMIGEHKKLLEAQSARISNLEAYTGTLKGKISVLLKKTENDDKLITAMRAELKAGKAHPSRPPRKLPQGTKASSTSAQSEKTISSLLKQVEDLSEKNESLELEVQRLKRLRRHSGASDDAALLMEDNEALKKHVERLQQECSELRNRIVVSSRPNTAPLDGLSHEELIDKLSIQEDEIQALHTTISSMDKSRQEELQLYEKLLAQYRDKLDRASEEGELGGETEKGSPKPQSEVEIDAKVLELQKENEILRIEVREIKRRYNALMTQQQYGGKDSDFDEDDDGDDK
eukprot:TRINITY_DN3014_c0_g1_i1.p1 TRINITY_DN3014_c0_g1~~TRINITY_DN3014_c0_g1_i1.p1  ORF type:complete len:657 (+),score=243.03 TRINITY_DN3014_c0_g1_i1:101-1972(+)